MRLELGSGGRPAPGYVHLDIRQLDDVQVVDDATTLARVQDGSCEAIRAAHLLEHFSWRETDRILALWRSKLAPDGELRLEVPNLAGHVTKWRAGIADDEHFVEALYGEQDHEFNYHRTAFTRDSLLAALTRTGYRTALVEDIGLVLVATASR